MGKATVVGIRFINFQPKDGDPICGYRYYFTYEETDVAGVVAEEAWLDEATAKEANLALGDVVILIRNKKGRINGAYHLK